jgi:hypothetical protein
MASSSAFSFSVVIFSPHPDNSTTVLPKQGAGYGLLTSYATAITLLYAELS